MGAVGRGRRLRARGHCSGADRGAGRDPALSAAIRGRSVAFSPCLQGTAPAPGLVPARRDAWAWFCSGVCVLRAAGPLVKGWVCPLAGQQPEASPQWPLPFLPEIPRDRLGRDAQPPAAA